MCDLYASQLRYPLCPGKQKQAFIKLSNLFLSDFRIQVKTACPSYSEVGAEYVWITTGHQQNTLYTLAQQFRCVQVLQDRLKAAHHQLNEKTVKLFSQRNRLKA